MVRHDVLQVITMTSRSHLRIVAWISLVLALLNLVPSMLFVAEQWRNTQAFSGLLEGFNLVFCVFAVFVCIITLFWSLFYFRIATVYFQTAAGELLFPTRLAVILIMIVGFPHGTALGAYALYARKQHMIDPENAEPERMQS